MSITLDLPGDDRPDRLDAAEFAALYARHRAQLYRYCRKRTHDRTLVEDIVQEVFTRAFAGWGRFQAERDFWPWISSIATRVCIDAHRRAVSAVARDTEYAFTWYRDPGDSTSATALFALGEEELGHYLAALPPRQRVALTLFAFDEWSYEEIARYLGSSATAVKALIRRARATLRDARGRWVGALGGIVRAARLRWQQRLARADAAVWSSLAAMGGSAAGVLSNATMIASIAIVIGLTPVGGEVGPLPGAGGAPVGVVLPAPGAPGTGGRGAPATAPRDGFPGYRQPPTGSAETSANQALASLASSEDVGSDPESISAVSMVASSPDSGDRSVFVAGDWAPLTRLTRGRHVDAPLLVSHDDATSWHQARALGLGPVARLLLPPAYPRDNRIFAVTAKGLQVSTDDGETFVTLVALADVTESDISPRFDDNDPTVLLVAGGRLLRYRDDTGLVTPVAVSAGSGSLGDFRSVAYSTLPGDSGTVVLGAWPPALVRPTVNRCHAGSVLDGTELTRLACTSAEVPGYTNYEVLPLRLPTGNNGRDLFLPLPDVVLGSTDGGRTLDVLRRSALEPSFSEAFYDMAVVPGTGGRSAVMAQQTFDSSNGKFGWGPQLSRTDDGGRHWTFMNVPLEGFEWATKVLVTGSGRIVVGGGGSLGGGSGMACSADGGRTWGRTCPPPS